MKLIIAEKPSVAVEIGKVLGAIQKENSCLKGNGYIISWCYGHLVGLAEPEYYNESYKKWRLEDLPIIPDDYKLSINDETKEHFYYLKNLMNNNQVSEVICATDSGREGELIFRFVYKEAKCNKPVKRLWVSSLTEESIRNGFNNLKDSKDYDNLYYAGINRAIADWLVGLNATRYFSVNYGDKITVGRVQTSTLNILVEREIKIKKHKKEKNYKILLCNNDFKAESRVFESESKAKEIFNNIKDKDVLCTGVDKNKIHKKTPKLYDLTLLQRDCNNILGLTAQETLSIAQSLYEKKIITYPRTDSNYISDDMLEETLYIVDKVYNEFNINKKVCNIEKIINNSKITDHHAIIPTKNISKNTIEKLTLNEQKIIKIICKRLLEATYNNATGYESKFIFKVDNVEFKASYQFIEYHGYLEIERIFLNNLLGKNINFEEEKLIFNFEKGQVIKDFKFSLYEYFTAPPKRFTEDSLLSAMENITKKEYKEIDDDAEKKGLGTPATRASIIEKLINVGYIERKGKNLVPTEKGINTIKIVDEKIKSPLMTAEWEVKLQEIEKGIYDKDKFLDEIIEFTESIVTNKNINTNIKNKMTNLNNNAKKEKEVIGICPCCKNKVYESEKNFYCSNRECTFTMFKEDKFFKDKKVKLTKTKVKELLKNKAVEFDKLYSEKTNKFYKAKVTFEVNGKYVNYKLIF